MMAGLRRDMRRSKEHQGGSSGPSTPHPSTVYWARIMHLKADIERMERIVASVQAGEQTAVEQSAIQLPPEAGRHGKLKELRRQAENLVEKLNSMVIADEQEEAHGSEGREGEDREGKSREGGGRKEEGAEGQRRPGEGEDGRGQGGQGEDGEGRRGKGEDGGGQGGKGEGGGGQGGKGEGGGGQGGKAEGGEGRPRTEEESADKRSRPEGMELDERPEIQSEGNLSAPIGPAEDAEEWQSDHESDINYEASDSDSDSDSKTDSTTTESSKSPEPASGPVQYEARGLEERVQQHWSNLRDYDKVEILDRGIADLKRKLRLKKFRPEGQHLTNYEGSGVEFYACATSGPLWCPPQAPNKKIHRNSNGDFQPPELKRPCVA
jgi:hypothetical protein